ncbi:MAG: FAD-dependent monooxygenase [Nannocystaceae bacterium]
MRSNQKKVLVSGASFAGLATAYWMRRLGYDVTVVEIAPGLRRGGTAVDIKGDTLSVVQRMGLLEPIRANRLSLARWEIKDERDVTVRSLVLRREGEPPPEDAFEVERDVLLDLLFDAVKADVELVFDDRVVAMAEAGEGVEVAFARGAPRTFDLVFGCDGIHSGVRALWFGPEALHSHFLEQYFSITIVDESLIERDTAQMFNVPGKAVMLNAYKDKTDIIFAFVSERELAYDHRDEAQQRRIIADQFAGVGWRTAALLEKVRGASSFYFDKLCQIRMPSWTRGRVALVGDAGYCPSPAAGMGGSIALDGAAALADAMRAHEGDHVRGFLAYDAGLRPTIERIQAEAVRTGLESLVPRTEEAIRARNARTDADF